MCFALMPGSRFQVIGLTVDELQQTIENSMHGQDVEDYTFEERYCRGVQRIPKPAQDELDRCHFTRLESIITRKEWEVFSVFAKNCIAHPNKVACVWLDGDGKEEARWTYAHLYDRARSLSAHLCQTYKLVKGDRVLLVYEPCIEFFAAFWACAGMGIIAVPVCPPDPFNPNNDFTDKLRAIWHDAKPKLILTSAKYKDTLAAARTFLGTNFDKVMATKDYILDITQRLWVATNTCEYVPRTEWDFPAPDSGYLCETDTVFLQYTSGSTGGAKGVEVQHRMLGANSMNCVMLSQGLGSLYIYQFSLGVSWLPTFHDMGLIGFHVAPMLVSGTMVYMSPLDFIQNPILWLKVVSRFKHVASGAPPFALDLCTRRVTPQELQQLDLSGLEVLVLGAEPIRASYMEEFTKKFLPYGFQPKAYMTCFGMAENVLHVAGKWSNKYEARKILVDSQALAQHRLVVYRDQVVGAPGDENKQFYTARPELLEPADTSDKDCQWLVSSGELIPFSAQTTIQEELHQPEHLPTRRPHFYRREVGSFVAIVDPDTLEEVPDGHVGEVWVCGPSKTHGYYNKPEISEANFRAKLRKATTDSTKKLLEWAKRVHKDPVDSHQYSCYTLEQLAAAREPLIRLMRSSFSPTGEVEWLRSGDMGVIYSDNIFITGRIKDMVIIRGQNYYADDIEHAVTAGKSAVDVAEGAARAITTDPTLAPLGFLRPGSAIAYSINITADSRGDCAAARARVEGEHLCVMVELAEDVTAIDGDIEEVYEVSATPAATPVCSPVAGLTVDGPRRRVVIKKQEKSGNQAPLWQRAVMKYGGDLFGGISRTYAAHEQQLMAQITGTRANESWRNMTCYERVKLMMQRAFLVGMSQGVSLAQRAITMAKIASGIAEADGEEQEEGNTTTNGPKREGPRVKNKSPDEATLRMRARYSDKQLDEIAAAVRRAIALKFMLQVGQVVFLAPRSIKKTSSGKKRRAEMVVMVEGHYLEHRVVRRCYARSLQEYYRLKAEQGNAQ